VAVFRSFIMGGFECSTHRLRSGKRLDLLNASQHDRYVRQDYKRLQQYSIQTARSGIRWHLIEPTPGRYDWSSVLPMLTAARDMRMQIIWDLCHYGWPDDIDIFSPEFTRRFVRMVSAFARVYAQETDDTPFFCPINEISFFSWGGGDVGYLNPFAHGRGFELKVQLVRTAIEAMDAVWDVLPQARFVHAEPVINVIAHPDRPGDAPWAEGHRIAQYQAWDMLSGRIWPQVGGNPKYLDIVGMNYYRNNQWIHGGHTVERHDPLYRPFRQIAREVYERYERPIFIAETGTEDDARADWFTYMADETRALIEAGIPIEGICLYPILCHPGWDNDRHCFNGLWDYCSEGGQREVYQPLAQVVQTQMVRLHRAIEQTQQRQSLRRVRAKPNLCLFTDSLEPSGMGEHMLTLADELKSLYIITMICPPSKAGLTLLQRAKNKGLAALPLEVRGQSREAWERLRDWLQEHAIDIFHAHAGIGWEGHDAIYAAYHARVPHIVRTEHLPYLLTDPAQQAHHRELIAKVDRVICVSEEACASFENSGVPAHKLHTIYNGIQPPQHRREHRHIREQLALPAQAQLVLTVARMTDQKGHAHLLEAMAAGVPIIATRVTGTSEVIQDRVSGCLVDPTDAHALAAGILEVLADPALAQTWSSAARRRFDGAFSAARMAAQTHALYGELLQPDIHPSLPQPNWKHSNGSKAHATRPLSAE
jgi:glycosyltransferase involved in cell wall biosynthesis